ERRGPGPGAIGLFVLPWLEHLVEPATVSALDRAAGHTHFTPSRALHRSTGGTETGPVSARPHDANVVGVGKNGSGEAGSDGGGRWKVAAMGPGLPNCALCLAVFGCCGVDREWRIVVPLDSEEYRRWRGG